MEELNRFLVENLTAVVGAIGLLVLVLLVLVAVQTARLGRAVRAYRDLVRDGQAGSLAEVLAGHVRRVDAVDDRLSQLDALHGELLRRTETAIRHVGLVRFNPFEDTGGDQSFAIALLDERQDGVVISSLHGRANTRIFAKAVTGGTSSHSLSAEEAQAIRVAVNGSAAGAPER
ncbi:MAG TPA: DUF4446 family protein [candidate division Zixibacteria bacterium]|nr:DUF4446 family protein [candidate division Zixibacteria bacterium]